MIQIFSIFQNSYIFESLYSLQHRLRPYPLYSRHVFTTINNSWDSDPTQNPDGRSAPTDAVIKEEICIPEISKFIIAADFAL